MKTATKVTIEFAGQSEVAKLADLLSELAMTIEDDGNQGHPDAALAMSIVRQLRGQR